MSTFTFFTTPATNFGRSGYNGPDQDDDNSNQGRSGYNGSDDNDSHKGPMVLCFGDDDDKDQGRSGYN
ncbi:hypothetical protein GMORB2_2806 [Geosmithia morbida]|uniref:Uncharacterized protein n=1 Tax=Geosmithia morbida TaxID=1094350 RepID=A0A9P4YS28_9HYPO|nr:uncharacterized protein GMORB2_2806 [Geosmithia morbida]KAF4120802.1 hypothetical protein GMORB2_2806 [Geosmithia morbida]